MMDGWMDESIRMLKVAEIDCTTIQLGIFTHRVFVYCIYFNCF